jgi:hypothetical protein
MRVLYRLAERQTVHTARTAPSGITLRPNVGDFETIVGHRFAVPWHRPLWDVANGARGEAVSRTDESRGEGRGQQRREARRRLRQRARSVAPRLGPARIG